MKRRKFANKNKKHKQPAKGVMSWDCYIKVPNS